MALASSLKSPTPLTPPAAGSATALFALARTGGWVAHALEQYEAGFLVRPRARYRQDPAATTDEDR